MCGICGIVRTRAGEPLSQPVLAAMTRTLIHRGPDDEGLHIEELAGLGSRRLSIIDVAGGHMPLGNEDGTVWAVHNGEVYNFPELRPDLEARGHRFRTRSDTETIVHGYEDKGADFVHRMRGMFATALWDGRRERLVILRDRLGIKPVYYTLLADGTLVFGSELKAILAHPRVPRELEPRALDLYLTVEYVPAPWSIFKGIFKLPAGHTLTYENGRVTIASYWDVRPDPAAVERRARQPLPETMDELYALLKESVRLRLISDVPLGAFLSGGIDSSTIVGLMRELGASPLKTFSIGFRDRTYDELDHARRIARRFATEHEELVCEPQALDLAENLVRHLDEPLADFSLFPTYLVSKMARERVTVILSGDGGDELFGGYEHYQAQRLAGRALVRPAGRLARLLLRKLPPGEKKKGTWNKLRRFTAGLGEPARLRHLRWMTFQSARTKAALYRPELAGALGGIGDVTDAEPFRTVFSRLADFDPLNAELYLDLKTYLVDDIMVKVDRMSMAASLEAREPLLDHKLVEFAFTLPGDFKLRGGRTKWIFKKTMARLLPPETLARPKEGFSIPIKHWLRTELREMLLDRLSESRLREEGLFEPAAVRRMIEGHLAGRENYSHELWALLVFALWKETYL